jgi:alginate O-acetyltransferase complex protein AlgI
VGLLLASTIVDFVVGWRLRKTEDERKRKLLLAVSIFFGFGVLGFFKYFNFFVGSFNAMVSSLGLRLDFRHMNVILPVGISLYTFQSLTYTVDIYGRKLVPTHSFIDFAVYIAFSPSSLRGRSNVRAICCRRWKSTYRSRGKTSVLESCSCHSACSRKYS